MSGLNMDRQFALEQVEGNAELLQELLAILLESCATDLAAIKQGAVEEKPALVQTAAHSIKGAAASLGISGLRDLAFLIELDAKQENLQWLDKRISRLERMLEELKKFSDLAT